MTTPNRARRGAEAGSGRKRDAVRATASRAKTKASDAASAAISGIENNPVAIVLGGLAVGAIAGALLPRSDRERDLLAPLGARVSDSFRAATDAARTAGEGKLAEFGISKDAAREQVGKLFQNAAGAASAVGTAAFKAARTGNPAD